MSNIISMQMAAADAQKAAAKARRKKREAKRSILCSQYTTSEKQKEAFFGSIFNHEAKRSIFRKHF